MSKPKDNLATLISELTCVWKHWMLNNSIAHDPTKSIKQRSRAVDDCESLIDTRYSLIERINKVFSK